jgi:hypothetical protein
MATGLSHFLTNHLFSWISAQLNLRNTSFLLEKLVLRENLNTLIVNLYPGNKGYSLAFRNSNETHQQDVLGRNVSIF